MRVDEVDRAEAVAYELREAQADRLVVSCRILSTTPRRSASVVTRGPPSVVLWVARIGRNRLVCCCLINAFAPCRLAANT